MVVLERNLEEQKLTNFMQRTQRPKKLRKGKNKREELKAGADPMLKLEEAENVSSKVQIDEDR